MKKKIAMLVALVVCLSCFAVCPVGMAETDGILRVALPSASPFSGLFSMVYAIDLVDAAIAFWINEPLLSMDEHLSYDQDGAATYSYDKEAKTLTLSMKPGVKWHDGVPVTMEDLVFAYEVIAHPSYEGYFFTETLGYIEGMGAYQSGAAEHIAGLVLSEDKNTLTIRFSEFRPSILEGGIWVSPLPKHQLGAVKVEDMAADEGSRAKVLGFGPFKVAKVVPGETVELTPFEDYWQGCPKLEGVTLSIVSPDLLPAAMERGLYDLSAFPADAYGDHKEPENYSYLSQPDRWYQFTGFHLGHYDAQTGENVTDPEAKMGDLALRQAMGYAVDLASICEDFYNGLRGLNPTVLPPAYAIYQSPEVTGYPYDPEQAKALLTEAGYLDRDGDGFRETPEGKPLVIHWAVPNNNAETVVQFKIQCWQDVGLNVQLLSGKLMEVNAYYDMLFRDDPQIDMFEAGWVIEASPNLQGAWGRSAIANFTRFESLEMDRLLAALDAMEAWDEAARIKAYHDFGAYFFAESPAIPTVWRANLYAVHHRVKNFSVTPIQIENNRHLIELADAGAR